MNMYYRHQEGERGFSLVEMIVAVSLFAVVMLVAVGALLSLVTANRKARALESVINNLNISLDGMVRSIRMGTHYNCGSVALTTADCATTPGTLFSFAPYGSDVTDQSERTVYYFQVDDGVGRLYRSFTGDVNDAIPITAPEVSIDTLRFYVAGTQPGDINQPKAVVVVKGTAGTASDKTRTTFYIQATAVQRSLDI